MMLSPEPSILLDAGMPLMAFVIGVGCAALTFILVVILEARIMKRFFPGISPKKRLVYALIVNTVSTILSLPCVYLASNSHNMSSTVSERLLSLFIFIAYATLLPMFKFQYVNWMAVLFVLTLMSEFGCLVFLLKPGSLARILRYTILSNLVSLILVLLSFLPWMIFSFFLA